NLLQTDCELPLPPDWTFQLAWPLTARAIYLSRTLTMVFTAPSISLLRPGGEPPFGRSCPIRQPWLLTMRAIYSCQPGMLRAAPPPSIKSLQARFEPRLPSMLVLHYWLVIARAICLCQATAAAFLNLLQAEY